MIEVINITSDTLQRHTIATDGKDVIIRLRFVATVQSWFMDVSYGDKTVNGIRLSVGVFMITSARMPVDFYVRDNLDQGLDPFSVDDFSTDRCTLFMAEREDMEFFRGVPVPL